MPTPRHSNPLTRRLLLASFVFLLAISAAAAVVAKSLEGRASTPRCVPAKAPVPPAPAALSFATDDPQPAKKKAPACPRPAGRRPTHAAQ
jgi:hypothetical protein